MSDRDQIAPCADCREVGPCRPYGQGEPPELLCINCAQSRAENVTKLAQSLGEFLNPNNSSSVH